VTSEATSKFSYLKVRMSYGDGPTNEDFVAGYTEDVDTYIALPMEVKGLHNSGSLDIDPISIDVAAGRTFFDALARRVPFAPIFLYITEVITAIGPSGTSTESIKHAIGDYKLQRVTKNPEKRQGLIRCEFEHHKKTPEKVRLGMACNPGCEWTLGDKSCQITPTPETGTVATIVRKKLSLTNPTDTAVVTTKPSGTFPYWYRGFVELDGLRIGIRDWTDSSYDFELEIDPPASWVGQVVTLHPGCGKDPGDCVGKFANAAHFGGFGIAVPSYDPGLEVS
jgi:hypothetical protein